MCDSGAGEWVERGCHVLGMGHRACDQWLIGAVTDESIDRAEPHRGYPGLSLWTSLEPFSSGRNSFRLFTILDDPQLTIVVFLVFRDIPMLLFYSVVSHLAIVLAARGRVGDGGS